VLRGVYVHHHLDDVAYVSLPISVRENNPRGCIPAITLAITLASGATVRADGSVEGHLFRGVLRAMLYPSERLILIESFQFFLTFQ
jgi:hypothetical protein